MEERKWKIEAAVSVEDHRCGQKYDRAILKPYRKSIVDRAMTTTQTLEQRVALIEAELARVLKLLPSASPQDSSEVQLVSASSFG